MQVSQCLCKVSFPWGVRYYLKAYTHMGDGRMSSVLLSYLWLWD